MDGWMFQIYTNGTRENNIPVSVKQAQSPAPEHFSHHHHADIWDRYLHLTMETGVHFALTVMLLLVRSRCWGGISDCNTLRMFTTMNLQTVEETPTSRRASGDGLVSWIGGLRKNGKAAWPGIGAGSLTASRFSQGARGGGGGGRSGDEAVA